MNYNKKKLLNRVWATVLSVAMVITMLPMNVAAIDAPSDEGTGNEGQDTSYGTVTTYTGGTVSDDGTEYVKVLVENAELQWVPADPTLGRNEDGWWVGIAVTAPAGFSEDATYKTKGNPTAEYGDAKRFAEYKDGENYIQLWFPVSAESLEKFASENRNITMMYAFDWNADSTYEQEVEFSVVPSGKIKLMKDGEQTYPAATTGFGTVTTYTNGTVTGDGTANVAVVIEETSLQWVEGNALRAEGWWVGIGVNAPEGFSNAATYRVKSNPDADYGEVKKFIDNKDGEKDIQLWFPVSPDSLQKFISENRNLTMMYAFDWNADGTDDQTITFSVTPSEKIVLMKGEAQVYPLCGTVSTYTDGTITGNGTSNVQVLVEEAELQWVPADASVGRNEDGWWVGIRVDAPEGFSADAAYMTKNNPTAEFDEANKKSFVQYKDGDNYIQLWFRVTPESLEDFANNKNRDIAMFYTFDWNADGNYEQNIEFAVAPSDSIALKVNVTAEAGEGGSVSLVQGESTDSNGTLKVNAGSDVKVVYAPESDKMVDKVEVNGTALTASDFTKDSTGISSTINNITTDQKVVVSFKDIATADKADLTVNSDAALRTVEGTDNTTYIIKKGNAIIFSTAKAGIRLYDSQNNILGGGEDIKAVEIKENTTISRVQLYYQGADDLYAEWHDVADVNKFKIVVDDDDEDLDASLTAIPAANANGYHNSNVTFEVTAEDTGDYSGLKLVEYWITYNGTAEQKIELYSYKDGENIKNSYTDSEKLVVDAAKYNSKDVKVTLHVVDRADNEVTVEKELKINSTKPTVELDITGEQNTNAQAGYYKGARSLIITIVDREDTFIKENVVSGLVIKKDGAIVAVSENDITWENSDDKYIGKYNFSDDGHYELSFSYTNLAGLSNEGINAPDDKAMFDFYIDTVAPDNLKVTYNPSFINKMLEKFTFGFYKAPVEVVVEAVDNTAGVEQFEYSYTVDDNVSSVNKGQDKTIIDSADIQYDEENNRYYASFKIPAQFRGKVAFSTTDKAGWITNFADDKSIVVDDTSPVITVTYDNNSVINGEYYKEGRIATIKIDEANFFATKEWGYADLEDELLVLTVEKTLNDGTYSSTKMKPEFTYDGEEKVYKAEIAFDEDADYTFDVTYTDRSGNVYDDYQQDKFVVDKTAPEISIEKGNGAYFNADRTVKITVVEHNFRASDFKFTAEAYDVTGKKVIDLSTKAYSEFLKDQDKWTEVAENTWETSITFDIEGNYAIGATYTDLAGNPQKEAITDKFCIDKSEPQDLKISYESDFIDVVLEKITFGFYKAPVKVTIEATEEYAGVKNFVYSYAVEEGASSINAGNCNVEIAANVDGETNRYYASFEIPAQFRGNVSFTAYDKATNNSFFSDKNVVVVDDIAPGVTVTYDNNSVTNDEYYKANRTATIKIDEANFFGTKEWSYADLEDELLVLTVEKTLNDGTYSSTKMKPEFTYDEEEKVYKAEIAFDEDADYMFDVTYTDRSGNVYDNYQQDKFTVDKIAPEISIEEGNGAYFNSDRTVKLTVVEHNFRASDFEFAVEAYDVTGKKAIDLSSKVYSESLKVQSNWKEVAENTWETSLIFDIEGNYKIGATYTDLAGNPQKEAITDEFCIDKSEPQDLKISYESDFIDVVLENITFGFYKAPVKVTIEATDEYAGVKNFVYSYAVEEGASSINTGNCNMDIAANVDGETNRYYASFEIPAQFRGNVSFTAYDKATNSSFLTDANITIVDNVAPGVSVSYDNNSACYDNYYKADRTAIIKIDEANFFGTKEWGYADLEEEYLLITVEKTLNDGTYSSTKMKPEFTYDETEDKYKATILFDENADYTFDIKYTDRSGNVYDEYPGDKFTIDKIDPTIQVSYDNNTCNNSNQFKADREATITITEHNFKASDVVAVVKASGTEVASYAEKLAKDESWTHEGDVHTAKIQYTEEAHYEFAISYTDMAGRSNKGIYYGTSVAPTKFTLDKTAPTELDIRINDVSVAGSMTTLAFDKFYGQTVTVKLSANCDISGLQSLQYQKVPEAAQYDEKGIWSAYDAEKGIVVAPNEKFIIYFRAEDRAGNVSIIRSTGIVVDDKLPIGETNAPEIDIFPDGAGAVHGSSVGVSIKVVDPAYVGETADKAGYYSGLSSIAYKIYATDIDASETGELLSAYPEGIVKDKDGLISSWSGNITVNSSFNSNNVIVEVTATDNAGNVRTSSTSAGDIKIDTTAPIIEISYNNNNMDGNGFFQADRVATVTIIERNFSSSDVNIAITNTDGTMPGISDWSESKGGGNGDDTRWTATIAYTADGDYTFGIAFADAAGNACSSINYAADSAAPTAFTIDKTIPVVDVMYDNNAAWNSNYYNAGRTAVVRVREHNFNPERVEITLSATNDGVAAAVPAVGGWISNGDEHTAVIRYTSDALYHFDVAVRDNAGNEAADFAAQSFYIDQTAPALSITGVENNSANSGAVIPVITYSDTNYDPEQVTITLEGANRKLVALDGTYANIHNGREFTFADFANKKEVDDIYTLTATLTDRAGNTSTEEITFSVNRFGSTYLISEEVEKLNGSYVQAPIDVVISEVNANELSNIKLTLFKNNETIVLKEGTNYSIDVEGGNGKWYQYTYTIFKSNFEDDGVYRLSLYSEDEAGNVAENTLDTKNMEISFGVDKTKPNIIVENLESGITYALEGMTAKLSISDNLILDSVQVYLDDLNIPYKTWTAEEIAAGNGEFAFDIPGDSTGAHEVRIVSADVAGNEQITEISDFFVTTNLLVRYVNNKPLLYGSIAGMVLLIGATVFLLVYKREKSEEEA